jgi:hypothetical protein
MHQQFVLHQPMLHLRLASRKESFGIHEHLKLASLGILQQLLEFFFPDLLMGFLGLNHELERVSYRLSNQQILVF